MDRKNLLADIRKLRSDGDDDNNTVSPPPVPSHLKAKTVKESFDVDDPNINNNNNNTETDSTMSRVRRKKKKKKHKSKGGYDNEMDNNDGSNNNNNNNNNMKDQAMNEKYSSLNNVTSNRDIFDERARNYTRISVLEDGIPNSRDILNFSNYSPNLQWTFAFGFLASVDVMINIPTLYDAVSDLNTYNGSSTYFYVYIFSIYVGMQLVGTVLMGIWMDRRPIVEILAFSAFLMAIGNLMYTHGVAKHLGGLLLCGRGLCGIASSILVVGYAHVTRYTKRSKRESRIQAFRFVTAIGTIFGPLLGVVVSGGAFTMLFWEIGDTNAGAFIVMCLSLLYLFALIIWMFVSWRRHAHEAVGISRMLERSESIDYGIEPSPRNESSNGMAIGDDAGGSGGNSNNSMSPSDLEIGTNPNFEQRRSFYWAPHRFCSLQAFLLWFLYSIAVFAFWSFEAAIIPIGGSTGHGSGHAWDTQTLYSIFVFIGIIYLLSFMANRYIADWFRIKKGKRVIASLLLMVIGAMFLTNLGITNESDNDNDANTPPTWQVVLATPFLTLGFCIATLQLPAMYCKLVGASMGDLGIRMSWFFGLAGIGMLAGPVYGFIVIDTFGSINFVAHTSALLLVIAALVGFGAMHAEHSKHGHSDKPLKNVNLMGQDSQTAVLSPRNDLQTGLLGDRL